MKKLLFLFLSIAGICFTTQAQKETDHWFFGVIAGLDFTSGSPVPQTGAVYSIPEGCASISTPSGTLLFYTDGSQVWDANHNLMPNGTGLHGGISSTQSCIIVPTPASATQFYIFTTAEYGDTAGFKYSMVDMSLNGGTGDVSIKNVPIEDSCTEKLAAIRTNVGGAYWIVIHKWGNDAFYAYQLTALGLQPPVVSHAGIAHTTAQIQNTYGQIKFNMCGTKLANAAGYLDTVEIFDFNMNSGVISNPITLPMSNHIYGTEFSPNSNLLYISCYDAGGTLLQYDISSDSLPIIQASKTVLSVTPDTYGLQVASDGKIYVSKSYNQYLGVINFPNTTGSGCNYIDNAVNLDTAFNGYTSGLSLPSFMQTYFKNALIISCPDGAGIEDNMIESIGIYPNPSVNEFIVNIPEINEPIKMTVIDYTGKVIEIKNITETNLLFGSIYIPGIYFVIVNTVSSSRVFKVIKL